MFLLLDIFRNEYGVLYFTCEEHIPNETFGWKMWFSHLLKPYIHYVPVKSDLSDLIEKIQWCRG